MASRAIVGISIAVGILWIVAIILLTEFDVLKVWGNPSKTENRIWGGVLGVAGFIAITLGVYFGTGQHTSQLSYLRY